jgi:hypothetical protein
MGMRHVVTRRARKACSRMRSRGASRRAHVHHLADRWTRHGRAAEAEPALCARPSHCRRAVIASDHRAAAPAYESVIRAPCVGESVDFLVSSTSLPVAPATASQPGRVPAGRRGRRVPRSVPTGGSRRREEPDVSSHGVGCAGAAGALRACAKVTKLPCCSSQSLSRTARRPSHTQRVGTWWKIGFSSWARCRL